MILKNLLLFIAGMLFACIVLSLIGAYYMLHTEITEEMEENIIFWRSTRNKNPMETSK